MLNEQELGYLQNTFKAHPRGLPASHFVQSMLQILNIQEDTRVEIAIELIELFKQVDVNNDGTMEWEEFSNFCINRAFTATFRDMLEREYVEKTSFCDRAHHGGNIRKLKLVPELNNMILACEEGKKSIKLYHQPKHIDTKLSFSTTVVHKFMPTIDLQYEITTTEGMGTKGKALDAVYIPRLELIAASNTFGALVFYNMSSYCMERKSSKVRPVFVYQYKTKHAIHSLCWDESSEQLFGSGISPEILAWKIHKKTIVGATEEIKITVQENDRALMGHAGIIKTMLAIPGENLMVSGGMDSKLCIWDTSKNVKKGYRDGHTKGIHSLVYAGDGYVLSAGYESDIFCWDIKGTSFIPFFTLGKSFGGHQFPVVSVVCSIEKMQAFSVDNRGNFKWWDTRLDSCILATERVLQSFRVANHNNFNPVSMIQFPGRIGSTQNEISRLWLIAADSQMHLFTPELKTAYKSNLTAVAYNCTSAEFMYAYGGDIKCIDAVTGSEKRHFRRVVQESGVEITKMRMNSYDRKCIIGTENGEVFVINCVDGVRMKSMKSRFSKEISNIVCCGESNCFVVSSSDGSFRVIDDSPIDHLKVLRKIDNAHSCSICALGYSKELALIATGDVEGEIKIWDYQFCHAATPVLPKLPNSDDIVALQFVEPYPLLLSAHSTNEIWLWPTNKRISHDVAMLSPIGYINVDDKLLAKESSNVLTDMKVMYDPNGGVEIAKGIFTGRHILIAGYSHGQIILIDLSLVLKQLNIKVVPSSKLPINQNGYFEKRRFNRDYQTMLKKAPVLDRTSAAKVKKIKFKVVNQWDAHRPYEVTNIECIFDPMSIMSFSKEQGKLRVWRMGRSSALCGELYGEINPKIPITKRNLEKGIQQWKYPINSEKRKSEKVQYAQEMIAKMNLSYKYDPESSQLNMFSENLQHFSQVLRNVQADMTDPKKIEALHTSKKLSAKKARDRRVVGQMFGGKTWNLSDMEKTWEDALSKERAEQEIRIEKWEKEKEDYVRKASKKEQELFYYKELLSDSVGHTPSLRSQMPSPWLPKDDKDNWGINSTNRKKALYKNMYAVLNRGHSRNGKDLSLHENIQWKPNQFLEQQFEKLRKSKMRKNRRSKSKTNNSKLKVKQKKISAEASVAPVENQIEKEMTEEEKLEQALSK